MQGTAAIEYSWLPRDATPHNWTTEIISDLSLPITFVGLCTIDRRNIYPQKEVSTNPVRLQMLCHHSRIVCSGIWDMPTSMCQTLHPSTFSCIADINATRLCADVSASSDKIGPKFALLIL